MNVVIDIDTCNDPSAQSRRGLDADKKWRAQFEAEKRVITDRRLRNPDWTKLQNTSERTNERDDTKARFSRISRRGKAVGHSFLSL